MVGIKPDSTLIALDPWPGPDSPGPGSRIEIAAKQVPVHPELPIQFKSMRAVDVPVMPTSADSDFQVGLDAYNRGDYAEAARWYLLAAKQGDVKSQFNLGVMYRKGEGVPQDYGLEVHWIREAAKQGYAEAQYNLGFMRMTGPEWFKDPVKAYAWSSLALAGGFEPKAAKNRNIAKGSMLAKQVAEAQQLTRTYAAQIEDKEYPW